MPYDSGKFGLCTQRSSVTEHGPDTTSHGLSDPPKAVVMVMVAVVVVKVAVVLVIKRVGIVVVIVLVMVVAVVLGFVVVVLRSVLASALASLFGQSFQPLRTIE